MLDLVRKRDPSLADAPQNEYRAPRRNRHLDSRGSGTSGDVLGAHWNEDKPTPRVRSTGTTWFGTV